MSRLKHPPSRVDAALGHWLWAVPALLIVALIAVPELDRYSTTQDEFRTLINVGWVVDGPYSPLDVLQSLARRSAQQAPLYFWLVNLWGNFVPQEIMFARIVTVYCGLVFLAVCFRTIRDYVAPVCGLMALAIIASNAFQNLYITYARMYTVFLLTTALALWIYLRIIQRRSEPKRRDYAAFCLACLALAASHAMSFIFFLAVGAFHLLRAPKGGRWLRVCGCVATAMLLFAPWAYVMVSKGAPITRTMEKNRTSQTIEVLQTWAELISNGSPILLLIPLAGLALAWRWRYIGLKSPLLLIFYYVVVVMLVEETVGLLSVIRLRYLLPGVYLLLLSQAAGLYALYRYRRWMCLLALLWIVAGLSYHSYRTADGWRPSGRDRSLNMEQAPFHALGRHARSTGATADIYAYKTESRGLLEGQLGITPVNHFFDMGAVDLSAIPSPNALKVQMSWNSITAPSVWIYYQTSAVDTAEAEALDRIMKSFHYTRCQELDFALDTVLRKYWWSSLSCRAPQPQVSAETELIKYQFLGARLTDSGEAIAFSDKWMAQAGADAAPYQMSYQLLNEDRGNVAQLDLPLRHEGKARQFTIDISRAPAGRYSLATVLYEPASGERLKWSDGNEFIPEMLILAHIEL
ncbi:MAG: glycosyltransferase family 39 protein [Chloroflexi bacterium]|nr:glycosyltransferase family 39 protein [Chloroflexota bacterium]